MLSELIDELKEDSPFLRQIHDEAVTEGRQEGRLLEARAIVRELAQERFSGLSDADLAAVDRIQSLDRLHALRQVLKTMRDAQALRQALAEDEQ